VRLSRVGNAINFAARLCVKPQDGGILISPRNRLAVNRHSTVELHGKISFKGIRKPVGVFYVTGVAAACT